MNVADYLIMNRININHILIGSELQEIPKTITKHADSRTVSDTCTCGAHLKCEYYSSLRRRKCIAIGPVCRPICICVHAHTRKFTEDKMCN